MNTYPYSNLYCPFLQLFSVLQTLQNFQYSHVYKHSFAALP